MKKAVLAIFVSMVLIFGVFSANDRGAAYAAKKQFLYAVGGAGATSWVYGMFSVWAETVNPKLKTEGITYIVQVTAGSRVHTDLYKEGVIQAGCSSSSRDNDMWKGLGDHKGKPYKGALLMFPINGTFMHLVTLEDSGFVKFKDLEGKKVALGPQGFKSQEVIRSYFSLAGVNSDFVYGDLSECFQMLKEKRVAAVGYTTGAPFSQVLELAATYKTRLIGLTEEEVQKIAADSTGSPKFLTPKQYTFLKEPVRVIAGYQTMDVAADLPEEHVYKTVKATWENWGEIQKAVAACKVIGLDDIPKQFKPYHPGAIRYYEEVGVKIPDKLRP